MRADSDHFAELEFTYGMSEDSFISIYLLLLKPLFLKSNKLMIFNWLVFENLCLDFTHSQTLLGRRNVMNQSL